MSKKRHLTAKEAATRLDISLPTLYAYVSRGLIRSEAGTDDPRKRLYSAEDVDNLQARKEHRRNPEKLAETVLHWGAPLLESALTLIADGRLFYRGYDAIALATSHSVEQVAALLWTGDVSQAVRLFAEDAASLSERCAIASEQTADLTPLERFMAIVPLAAADDLTAYDIYNPKMVQKTGARILRLLTQIASGYDGAGMAHALQQGWYPDDQNAAHLLNAALILCADHELNASSFTARVVAAAGASPYAVVSAGLAALQGAKHGGHTERVAAFLAEIGTPEQAESALASRLKRGETIPGFGHKLYPDGDPRGALLLQLVAQMYPDSEATALAEAIVTVVSQHIDELPTIDVGLAVVARVLNLPPGGGLGLFALGRTIGWIGHALEAYADDRLIRPRARYIGDAPRL